MSIYFPSQAKYSAHPEIAWLVAVPKQCRTYKVAIAFLQPGLVATLPVASVAPPIKMGVFIDVLL